MPGPTPVPDNAAANLPDQVSPASRAEGAVVAPDTVPPVGTDRLGDAVPATRFSEEEWRAATARPSVAGYELLDELGRGGMGVVYKARQVGLKRIVALKMILAGGHASRQQLDRFRTEAEAVARLRHPNIVQVHEIGAQDGLPFFSLEFCEAGSLADRLRGTPLPPRSAAELVQTLAAAVQYAHEQNVVHRDLKPANVLLADAGREPSGSRAMGDARLPFARLAPKITDFGLARKLDEDGQTQEGSVMGTPSYMAPEQAAGRTRAIGPAADIYALGAILYELLTGRPPFRAATPTDTILQVLHQEPVPPRQLNAGVPRDLETVALKCLRKEPAQRYGSAGDLAEDLRRWLAGEPIKARPAGLIEKAVKWVRRKPLPAASVAVGLLILAAAVWGYVRYTLDVGKALAQSQQNEQRANATKGVVQRAMQNFYLRTSQNLLLNAPGMQPLRGQLLQETLGYYRDLIREYGDAPDLQAELADATLHSGVIQQAMGRGAAAIASFTEAEAIYRRLLSDRPADAGLLEGLGAALTAHARALQNTEGKDPVALSLYREGLAAREQAVAAAPHDPRCRAGLAVTLGDLAALLKEKSGKQHIEEAIELVERARRLREELLAADPDSPDLQFNLAHSFNQLANLQTDHQRKPDALANYQRARTLRVGLVERFPDNIEYRHQLGWSCNNIGLVLSEIGQPSEAADYYRQAMELREKLARENPSVVEFQHNLASSCNNLGLLLGRLVGKSEEALRAFERGRGIREQLVQQYPRNALYKARLGHLQQNIGNLQGAAGKKAEALATYAAALKIREELAAADPDHADHQKHLAYTLELIGNLQRGLDNFSAAHAAHERALTIRQKLVADNPRHDKFKLDLISSQSALGLLDSFTGRSQAALGKQRASLAMAEKLVGGNPGVTEYEGHLAQVLNHLGLALLETGDPSGAGAALERARSINLAIARAKGDLEEHQGDLAWTHFLLGRLHRHAGRWSEALQAQQAARAIRERLAASSPNTLDEASYLALAAEDEAIILLASMRRDEAVRAIETAITQQRSAATRGPQVQRYRRLLARHLLVSATLRATPEPVDEALGLLKGDSDGKPTRGSVGELVELACAFTAAGAAVEVRRHDCHRRAVEILQAAVRQGYRDRSRLQADPRLTALRDRSDFQAMAAAIGPER